MNVIRQSPGSYLASAAATSALIFQETFGGAYFFPVVIALSLILTGIVMSVLSEHFLGKSEVTEDDQEPAEETVATVPKIALGAVSALAAFMFLYWVINPIKFTAGQVSVTTFFSTVNLPTLTAADVAGAFVFTALLIPVAEEQFFRAFWGNLIIRFLPPGLAEAVAGGVFMTFHFAVYSIFAPFNPNLALLLTASGAVFVVVDLYSGDIMSSIGAHILNNSVSFLVGGSIIAVLFPGAVVPFPVQAVIVSAVPALWVARALSSPSKRRSPGWAIVK